MAEPHLQEPDRASCRCAMAIVELSWITGPSASGSENGIPSSMMSAPASARQRHKRPGTVEVRIARRKKERECFVPFVFQFAKRPADSCHGVRPSESVAISLSPRPERFTMTTSPSFVRGIRRSSSAKAWADSSAGMIPSSCASRYAA